MSGLMVEGLKVNYHTDGLSGSVGDGVGANVISSSGCAIQPSPPDGHGSSSRVEEDSIQIDINRESLKKKLLFRRTLPELVNQGIHPPLNVPPAFADRQRHLQRAQTGDRLRQKLKERPDRDCLVQHHILEDTSVLVDRSLQEKQRLLKRSQLQSDLSGRLASRPGPLELITKNILQTDPLLKDGLIEGKIQFKKTTEVNDPVRHIYHPDIYYDEDDFGLGLDSSQLDIPLDFFSLVAVSDDGRPESVCCTPTKGTSEHTVAVSNSFSFPPASYPVKSPMPSTAPSTAPSIPPAPDIKPLLSGRTFHLVDPQLPPATAFSFSSSGGLQFQPPSASQCSFGGDVVAPSDDSVSAAVGSSNSRKMMKKLKNKNITKSRMIKFHEYKGPPSALKTNSKSRAELQHEPPAAPTSTSYGVLLEQQQMFLQWQLEFQQKALLSWQKSETTASIPVVSAAAAPPAAQSNPSPSETVQTAAIGTSGVFNFRSSPPSVTPAAAKPSLRLEDMKATYLRSECRRLGLPSHGSKPQLIERLVPQLSRVNLNAGCAGGDPAASFRNSDSSLSSASSDVTSPLAATLDSSFPGNQFAMLSGQKPLVPVTMDVAPARPPLSILPANVDRQSPGQSAGGYIRPVPPAFVLVRADPRLSQTSVHLGQVPCADVSLNDRVMPQVFGVTRPVHVPSKCFGSSQIVNMPVAQPVMLFTHPFEAHPPMTQAVKEPRFPPAANATTRPTQQAVRPAARPCSEGISSEEMVVRQQHVIASLEHSLQEYQRKLQWTEQRALLQHMQLSSLAQDNASLSGEGKSDVDAKAFDEKADVTSQGLSYGDGTCGQGLVSQNKPYGFNATSNSAVSNIGSGFSASEPVLHSAVDPFLPISHSNSFYGSTATDSYVRLPNIIPDSLIKPMLLSQCNTLDEMIEVLCKNGEPMLPICDDHLTASNPKESSMNCSDDDKCMFFLPDSDGSDLASGPEIDISTFPTSSGAFPFDSRTAAAFSKASNSLPVQRTACENVQKMDLCFATPETTCMNGNFDAADGLFGNMEWSDLDLDVMTSQLDSGQSFLLDNAYRTHRNFDFDVGDLDWTGRSSDTVPSQSAALSSVMPYSGNDYLSLLRQGDELDFFNCNKSDPFMSADLSAMIGFETLADGETSKT